jgi:hypothetical protein
MHLTPAIANSLWLASSAPAFLQFKRAARRPYIAQRISLLAAVGNNRDTAYGRAHGFGEVRDYKDFARKVPVVDYEELEPWVRRIAAGEQNVLTAERVTHLVPTSGTSSGRKLIPFTAAFQREFDLAIGPWVFDLYCRHPRAALGTAYWSITPAVGHPSGERSAVPIGFDEDSSYLGGAKKKLLASVMAVPSEVRLIQDVAVFRYVSLLCLLRRGDLGLISVWHPSYLQLLLDAMPTHWGDLLRDVHEGTCKYEAELPIGVREAIRSHSQPKRARQLEQAGIQCPGFIWPKLQMISCWGDAHAEGPLKELQRRLPNIPIQPKGLLATEAFVTFPLGGLYPLAVRSHFFEFLDDDGHLRLAHELKEGGEYEVIVTTGGGLYRYRLGDRVKVTDFLGETPSLRFLGRNGVISDRCGEKLSEAFVTRALREATSSLGEPLRFALLAPDETSQGLRYTLFIEANVDEGFEHRLDDSLKQNPHYSYCRRLGQLLPAQVVRIADHGYQAYIEHEMAQGKRMGEIKPCALSTDTGWRKRLGAEVPCLSIFRKGEIGRSVTSLA